MTLNLKQANLNLHDNLELSIKRRISKRRGWYRFVSKHNILWYVKGVNKTLYILIHNFSTCSN